MGFCVSHRRHSKTQENNLPLRIASLAMGGKISRKQRSKATSRSLHGGYCSDAGGSGCSAHNNSEMLCRSASGSWTRKKNATQVEVGFFPKTQAWCPELGPEVFALCKRSHSTRSIWSGNASKLRLMRSLTPDL